MTSCVIFKGFFVIGLFFVYFQLLKIWEDDLLVGFQRQKRALKSGAKYTKTIFRKEGVFDFRTIAFDSENNQLIVGARDHVFRLHSTDLSLIEEIYWPASNLSIDTCYGLGKSEDECKNHVKITKIYGERVLICGTGAFHPECTRRWTANLSEVISNENGLFNSPFDPSHPVTSIMTEEGDHYVGTYLNIQGSDWAIARSMGKKQQLRTKQSTHEYLYKPSFVASFELGGFVYFFFTEIGLESSNCGNFLYPRIARVCKDDVGGKRQEWRFSWLTFLKARLNCSIPGSFTFHYNIIRDVAYIPEEDVFYAVFTTPESAPLGSAVCFYKMSSVNDSFNGMFLRHHGISESGAWTPVSEPMHKTGHFRCEADAIEDERMNPIPMSQNYILMDKMVHPETYYPIFTSDYNKLTFIRVESVQTKGNGPVPLFYVANDNGTINKISLVKEYQSENSTEPVEKKYCLIDVFNPFPEGKEEKLIAMEYEPGTHSLYLASENYLIRLETRVCHRYTSKNVCLKSGDPHCGWNVNVSKCTQAPNHDPYNNFWLQETLSCPVEIPEVKPIPKPINGGWSSWSSWVVCKNEASAKANCRYRERFCNNPKPERGGKECVGIRIEVSTTGGGRSLTLIGRISWNSVVYFLFLEALQNTLFYIYL